MRGKTKRMLRSLQADHARLMNACGKMHGNIQELRGQVEDLRWRIDEAAPALPPTDDGGLLQELKARRA